MESMKQTNPDLNALAAGIRELATRALRKSLSAEAKRTARERLLRPIDYMRYAEFGAVLSGMQVPLAARVLDVSSPQWFSLYLASRHPEVRFEYINIIDSELAPFEEIARACNVTNLAYRKEDVRSLSLESDSYDLVYSISVIEHVYPESGGDRQAIAEIARVLKRDGRFWLTVPCKRNARVVYFDGPVYERGTTARNFYAREYDVPGFRKLIEDSSFQVGHMLYICERPGVLALDNLQWGPASEKPYRKLFVRVLRRLEKVSNIAVDGWLAKRYLTFGPEESQRLVNVAAELCPVR